jgi:hypothetical protein
MKSETWSLVIAIYAALISTGLLVLRVFENKLAAGWVKISTSFQPETDRMPAVICLRVTNKGQGAITVSRLDLDGPGPVSIPLDADLISSGPDLPFRLDARAAEVWRIDANQLKNVLRSNGWSYQVRGIVTLATGKRIWESIHRYTTVH